MHQNASKSLLFRSLNSLHFGIFRFNETLKTLSLDLNDRHQKHLQYPQSELPLGSEIEMRGN